MIVYSRWDLDVLPPDMQVISPQGRGAADAVGLSVVELEFVT